MMSSSSPSSSSSPFWAKLAVGGAAALAAAAMLMRRRSSRRSSLSRFLARARSSVAASKSSSTAPNFDVVVGNEAADLDSMVSAVAYALLRAETKKQNNSVVPLVNIPRREFALRGEASLVFQRAGLQDPVNELVFVDDLGEDADAVRKWIERNAAAVRLVDHNRLAQGYEYLAERVVDIIDHHKDEQLYLDARGKRHSGRNIQVVGSCATLVAERIRSEAEHLLTGDDGAGLAGLLLSTIVLDTNNMSAATKKGTPLDGEMIKYLQGIANYDDLDALNSELTRLRSDVSHLTPAQLLIKDTKYGTVNGVSYGIATVPQSLQACVAASDGFDQSIRDFAEERKLDLVGVMTTYMNDNDEFSRQLLLHSAGDGGALARSMAQQFVDTSSLDLESLSDAVFVDQDDMVAMQQRNVAASRKQVRPLVCDFLAKL